MKLNTTLYFLIGGFIFSLLIFGGAIYTTTKSEDNLFLDFQEVEEAHSFINDLEKVTKLINDLENSLKSYELTKGDFFLLLLNENESELNREIERINKRLVNSSIDNSNFLDLNSLISQRIVDCKLHVEKINSPGYNLKSDSLNLAKRDTQKEEIYSKIRKLNKIQKTILREKNDEILSRFNKTKANLTVVGYSAVLFTSLIFLFIWQYSRTHKKIEKDLLELNENKNKFFSIISHDLRGPVKNIVLMAQLLYQPANKTIEPAKLAKLIESSANNLSSLLDNLLKWSRLQMNKIDFQPEILDLRKLSDDVIQNLKVHADQKSIVIHNQILPETYVLIDQNMIATVIRNLISNALKFTNKGGEIEIISRTNQDKEEVIVKDNGVGMPKEIAKKIFSIDFRHVTKGTNKEEGTGLGLKLCREFVEKNNGKIWVESEVNVGSKFIFSVPLHKF